MQDNNKKSTTTDVVAADDKNGRTVPYKPRGGSRLRRPYTNAQGVTVMLTDRQKAFSDAVQATTTSGELITQTQAIYATDRNTARAMVHENLQKPDIITYLGDRGYRALDVLTEAMHDKAAKWADRISAANSLADRQFGRSSTTVNVKTTNISFAIDLTGNDVQVST